MTEHAASPRFDSEVLRLIYEIRADVSTIKQRQEEDHDRLFGNGRPGEIDNLDSRLKSIELRDAEEKGEKNSNRRWSAVIGSACGIVTGAISAWLVKHFG